MPTPATLRSGAPRVWVRRLVVWHDLGEEPFRDIPLRRGLNIVWSEAKETPDDDRLPTGHAAGKSLFCRALRFCLGEDAFASADDAPAIRGCFPQGGFGAEIWVGDVLWAVRRPFVGRGDLAVRDADVLKLAKRDDAGGFDAFLDGLRGSLGSPERLSRYPRPDGHHPWRFVLAWLTRDQECRVEGITSWRHKDSDSASPVRASSAEDRLTALRLALDLYDLGAHGRSAQIARAIADEESAKKQQTQAEARVAALVEELAAALQLPEEKVQPPPWSSAEAREPHRQMLVEQAALRRRALFRVAPGPTKAHPDDLRLEALDRQLAEKAEQLSSLGARVADLRKERSLLAEREPALHDAASEAKHPTCPYDGHRIDKSKSVDVCPLVKFPVPAEVARQRDEAVTRRKEVERLLAAEEPALARLAGEHNALVSQRTRLGRTVDRRRAREDEQLAERNREASAVMGARTLIDSLFERTEVAWRAKERAAEHARALQGLRDEESEVRKQQDVEALSRWFRVVTQRVLGADASGRVWMDGKGLHADIDRHSVALDALKVVLFDLAAMLYAADGHAHIPAFLIHDSPREGDLDLSTYRRIFRAMHEIAPVPDEAPFQYIITTTSAPPADAAYKGLVRLRLSASPSGERFLGVDL